MIIIIILKLKIFIIYTIEYDIKQNFNGKKNFKILISIIILINFNNLICNKMIWVCKEKYIKIK